MCLIDGAPRLSIFPISLRGYLWVTISLRFCDRHVRPNDVMDVTDQRAVKKCTMVGDKYSFFDMPEANIDNQREHDSGLIMDLQKQYGAADSNYLF